MMIDINMLANLVALVGCAFLLILWVIISRKLLGFFYICIGWAAIIAIMRSDHHLGTMLGIVLLTVFFAAILLASYAMIKAHKRAQSIRVYQHRLHKANKG